MKIRTCHRPRGIVLVVTLATIFIIAIIKSIVADGEYSWVFWDKSEKGALLRKSRGRRRPRACSAALLTATRTVPDARAERLQDARGPAKTALAWLGWSLEISRAIPSPQLGIVSAGAHCNFPGVHCTNSAWRAGRAGSCCSAGMTYLTDLIEALRRELREHGEMLARCDDAESHLTQNAAHAARTKLKALEEQEGVVERAQRRRERVQRALARRLRVPEETGLAEIIPLLPQPHQLLVRALAEEKDQLSVRFLERAAPKSSWSWDWLEPMESRQLAT